MAELTDQAIEGAITAYKRVFAANYPQNPTGKSYRDFTSRDIANIGNEDLSLIRYLLERERWSYVDQILPTNMSRAEYTRAVLRESARRGIADDYYLSEQFVASVNVARTPQGVSNPQPRNVQEEARTVAIFDASVDVVTRNAEQFVVSADVARALNITVPAGNALVAAPISNDTAAFTLGYTTGSMPEFRANGVLPFVATVQSTPEQIQQAYCPNANAIFNEGRALQQRDAFVAGFMQARIDTKTNFEPSPDEIGLFASCPTPARTPANNNTAQLTRRSGNER